MAAGYGDKEYWEKRYAGAAPDAVEEWIQPYAVLRPILSAYLRPTDAILLVGCGMSALGEDLHDDGYGPIVGIDYVPEVIELVAARAGARPRLAYRAMDACALDFDAASFNAVIDKGTLDAILLHPEGEPAGRRMVAEAARVLRSPGTFISISLRSARYRMPLFSDPAYAWTATFHAIPRRRAIAGADEEANSNWVYALARGVTSPPTARP